MDDLTFSTAFDAGEDTHLSHAKLHLPSVLAQVVDSVNAVEQKAGGSVSIRLHCNDISKDVEDIVADPFFRRVLFSLLSNAVKFSPANGVVDVSVTYSIKPGHTRPLGDAGANQGSGSITPRRLTNLKVQEPFVSSLSTILETGSDASSELCDSGGDNGYFTFHFRNSTVTPMNVSEVRNYFKSYYHSKSSGYVSSSGSVTGSTSYTGLSERPNDRRDGSSMSRCSSSPNFKDLQIYSGLGLGLYTAYNMVTLMGGTLECAVENDSEACFWFSVPSSISTCDAVPTGMKIQGIPGRGESESPVPQPTTLSPKLADVTEPRNNLFLTTSTPTPTPSFAVLSHTSYPVVQSPSPPDTGFYRTTPPTMKSFSEYSEQRILVVDDSRICQKVAGRTLSSLEFTLDYACNGLEACNKLAEKPLRYDAVLMDLRMPIMDGLTAIRRCRAELGLTKLPIVALTAEVGASIRDEAMKAGANWFLTKPAKAQELVSVMRALSFTRQ